MDRTSARAAVLTVIAIALLSSCRHGNERPPTESTLKPATEMPLTVEQVRDRFYELTGDKPLLEPSAEGLEGLLPRIDYLSFTQVVDDPGGLSRGVPVSNELHRKYGTFVIAVFEERVFDLAPPDSVIGSGGRGVTWRRSYDETRTPPVYFIAEKVYGPNVRLHWFPEDRRMKLSDQFERLDKLLAEITTERQR